MDEHHPESGLTFPVRLRHDETAWEKYVRLLRSHFMPVCLVPESIGVTPNYWSTGLLQNLSFEKENPPPANPGQFEGEQGAELAYRRLSQKTLFEDPGWAAHGFESVRSDLLLLLDAGWDVPARDDARRPVADRGSMELSEDRFPSFRGGPVRRLEQLNDRVCDFGWRGLGLRAPAQCAGEAPGQLFDESRLEAYWRQRAHWAMAAGVRYWKIEGGLRDDDLCFRRRLTHIAREEAPDLIVEHSLGLEPLNHKDGSGRFVDWGDLPYYAGERVGFSDVFRTTSVTFQLSVPTTLDRLVHVLGQARPDEGNLGLVNCGDEPYLAAALGCAMGLCRHPLAQPRSDQMWTPFESHRRLTEAVRALRWQRLAPAWGAGRTDLNCSDRILFDRWAFQPGDTGWTEIIGHEFAQGAPAVVARGLERPEVKADGEPPYVVASRHPEGPVAIASLPRVGHDRKRHTPWADVTVRLPESPVSAGADRAAPTVLPPPIGVFGRFRSLKIIFPKPLGDWRILAQDLATDEAVDVTDRIVFKTFEIVLDRKLIDQLGGWSGRSRDRSLPGLVVRMVHREGIE